MMFLSLCVVVLVMVPGSFAESEYTILLKCMFYVYAMNTIPSRYLTKELIEFQGNHIFILFSVILLYWG